MKTAPVLLSHPSDVTLRVAPDAVPWRARARALAEARADVLGAFNATADVLCPRHDVCPPDCPWCDNGTRDFLSAFHDGAIIRGSRLA